MLLHIEQNREDRQAWAKVLAKLDGELFPESPYSAESIESFIREESYRVYCILEEKEVLAYLFVLDSIDAYEVLKIAVREAYRRRGLASELLKQIEDKNILLEVREGNVGARAFYENLGFQKIALRKHYYRDNGENAVILLKHTEV